MQAFEYQALEEKLQYRILSVAASDHALYVGSTDRRVVAYTLEKRHRVQEGGAGKAASPMLHMRYESDFKVGAQASSNARGKGKGKVRQVDYFPSLALLVTLCDGAIEIWNAHTLQPGPPVPLPENSGVKNFAVDITAKAERICLQVHKTMWIYQFANRAWAPMSNFPIVKMDMSGHTLAVATKKDYLLMDVRNGRALELFPYTAEPAIAIVGDNEFLFAQDRLGLSINNQGVATRENYTWTDSPSELFIAPPYVLSMQSHAIEVNDQFSMKFAQSIPLKMSAFARGHKMVFAYSQTAIYSLRPLPITEQVSQMISMGEIKRGLELYIKTSRHDPDFKDNMRRFSEEAGDVSFHRGQFAQAFSYYKNSNVDPARILAYFPSLSANPGSDDTVTGIITRALKFDAKSGKKELVASTPEELLHEAKTQLAAYLQFAKNKYRNDLKLILGIDRALTVLLAQVDVAAFREHLRSTQGPMPFNDLERLLGTQQCWAALAQLYEHSSLPAKSLEIWFKLSNGDLTDAAVKNPINEFVKRLAVCNDFDLLRRYTPWLWDKNDQYVRMVFMNNEREDKLPHARVAELLKSCGMELDYLEYLVDMLGITTPTLHNKLAALLMQQVLLLSKQASLEKLLAMESELRNAVPLVRRDRRDRAGTVQIGTKQDEPLLAARKQLLRFLRSSSVYDAEPLLPQVEGTALREERLQLYVRLGQAERALSLIINEMKDLQRAEQFCAYWKPEYTRPDDDFKYDAHTKDALDQFSAPTGVNPFLQSLFKLYVGSSQHNEYPDSLDPVQVVHQLPSNIPLSTVSAYLKEATKQLAHRKQHTQVTRHVESAQHMHSQIELLRLQQAHTVVTHDSVCPVTGQRIAGQESFLRFPNGVVTSVVDVPRHICPVSGKNFRDSPVTSTSQ